MALVLKDRVKETTTTTGTGTVTLAGAVSGFQSFSAIGNANTTYYAIIGDTEWEIGIGTYTSSGTTLSRDTVLASSNSGSLVSFSAGTKTVFCDYPATKSVSTDSLATPPAIGATTPNTGTFTTLIGGGDSANYGQITGGATTKAVEFQTLGSDSNIALVLDSKGTGAIDLAAGSSGVNISNGGTVTAITRTAGGTGYTVAPTVTISAPTTAGGVQATATCTVTAGVVDTAFTITNAGSGYVEQPTITFTPVSGGSGATAYASVGGTPFIKSISRYLDTYASGGQVARFDSGFYTGVALTDFLSLVPSNFGGPTLLADNTSGSGNLNLRLSSSGTSAIDFFTNRTGQRQLQVSHTASAVNYVQVTGAATGGNPQIVSQGSDGSIGLNLVTRGTSATNSVVSFASNLNSTNYTFRIAAGSSANANYLQVAPAATTLSPSLSVQGTDTNIDLTLTPKGTGNVRFGTLTATADTAISGYITIKDSGGTTRKLAVIT